MYLAAIEVAGDAGHLVIIVLLAFLVILALVGRFWRP